MTLGREVVAPPRTGELTLPAPRLLLRPAGPADLDAMHALWTEPDVRRYLWDDVAIPVEQAREVLEATARHFAERRYGIWGVHERETDDLVGFAGCRPWGTGEPELLYGLRRAWWGRGFATEACHVVLAHVFETLGHPRVFAATDPPNVASIAVMERLGMTFDRRTEMHGLDTVVYRLSRERWRRVRDTGEPRVR